MPRLFEFAKRETRGKYFSRLHIDFFQFRDGCNHMCMCQVQTVQQKYKQQTSHIRVKVKEQIANRSSNTIWVNDGSKNVLL